MKKLLLFFLTYLFLNLSLFAQSSLIPDPDLGYSSQVKIVLEKSVYRYHMDNQHLSAKIDQIFKNKSNNSLEAIYEFLLPTESRIKGFATWDNEIKLEGMMLEKSQARSIYKTLRDQAIDPGLLQQQEKGKFQARIVPVLPWATKKLELEYIDSLKQDLNTCYFSIPLSQPNQTEKMDTSVYLTIQSDYAPIVSVESSLPDFQIKQIKDNLYKGFLTDNKGVLSEPLGIFVKYQERADYQDFFVHKNNLESTGYFLFRCKFPNNSPIPKKRVLFLIDSSFSMKEQQETIKKNIKEFLYSVLHDLKSDDEFYIAGFNTDVFPYSELFLKFSAADIHPIMSFIEKLEFQSGTCLSNAINSAGNKILSAHNSNDFDNYILLFSDGIPTSGSLKTSDLGLSDLINHEKIKICHFPVTENQSIEILEDICEKSGGFVLSGNDQARASKTFIEKTGYQNISDIELKTTKLQGLSIETVFPKISLADSGKELIFTGTFQGTGKTLTQFLWKENKKGFTREAQINFPEEQTNHSFVEDIWAETKINQLIEEIQKNYSEVLRKEIVALSKKYHILTPYTAFLAAPRSVLRPRFIKPGDPVIRVKAPPGTEKVTIFFPFDIHKECIKNPESNLFECRFLAPAHLKDGKYRCRLLLVMKNGKTITEYQTFFIDNTPPELKCFVKPQKVKRGEMLTLLALASIDTVKIQASLPNEQKVSLRYNPETGYSEGKHLISPLMKSGTYPITITATDRAENTTVSHMTFQIIE